MIYIRVKRIVLCFFILPYIGIHIIIIFEFGKWMRIYEIQMRESGWKVFVLCMWIGGFLGHKGARTFR